LFFVNEIRKKLFEIVKKICTFLLMGIELNTQSLISGIRPFFALVSFLNMPMPLFREFLDEC